MLQLKLTLRRNLLKLGQARELFQRQGGLGLSRNSHVQDLLKLAASKNFQSLESDVVSKLPFNLNSAAAVNAVIQQFGTAITYDFSNLNSQVLVPASKWLSTIGQFYSLKPSDSNDYASVFEVVTGTQSLQVSDLAQTNELYQFLFDKWVNSNDRKVSLVGHKNLTSKLS